jgi:hypothetical protein
MFSRILWNSPENILFLEGCTFIEKDISQGSPKKNGFGFFRFHKSKPADIDPSTCRLRL